MATLRSYLALTTSHQLLPQDCSELPLFARVDSAVASLPTFSAFSALFDNYVASPSTGEDHTEQEHQEELSFLQEVMQTDVMQAAFQFMVDRGILSIFHIGVGH